jgi:sugar-phosphatase
MAEFCCNAVMLDVDGTLVHSLAAVDRAWSRFAARHGLDRTIVISQIHGRRSIDSIRLLQPHLDADAEDVLIRSDEASDTMGVVCVDGALEFVSSLPHGSWNVVTSGSKEVATARLRAAGLPIPESAVFGDDVTMGKPAPDPYLLAAERLGVDPRRCVAFEDTLSGIRSASRAGMKVIALATSFDPADLSEADAVVFDFRSVSVLHVDESGIVLKT